MDAAIGYTAPIKHAPDLTCGERAQFSLTPTQTTNTKSTGSQIGSNTYAGNQAQSNQYTPGQAALQGQLGGAYSNLLNGQVPSDYTNNPNLVGAYTTAFNQNAPTQAFQGGAGTPQLQSNYAMGLQNLLANQFNTGTQNYQNSLAGASNFAQNPIGATGSTSGNTYGTQGFQGTTNQTISQPISLVNLLSALGGALGP